MGKILVTGVSGQLGTEIKKLSVSYKGDFLFADRAALDITDGDKVKQFLGRHPVEAVINSAAYTAVDKAESEPEMAKQVNCKAVEMLAGVCVSHNLKLVHLSTDYVFDGKNHRPYKENDPAAPVNVYGKTKWEGEEAIRSINPGNSVIIRTSWLYSSQGNNFVKTMLRLGAEKEEVRVIDDQVGTPTYAGDLAAAVLDILPGLNHKNVKTYHYTNEGVCTWFDFAKAIMEYEGLPCKVTPVPSSEYPTPAQRPSYSVLSKQTFKKDFKMTIPHWRDSLKKCLREIDSKL
ncbi:dTDP-4-dehydrorhamnose reductase [Sinomicrobium weinanense]|uniref:dTDP-4-dehydrorhamnose reductase n=1 Tax=Sinomicrobium weinanense TaxID=2842200 RepID=A0A926JPS9_9FLAO|nr:dTDP-4-dehydrorhamnose reductase [Sinomicrobium weinanense]MBC9795057.1 dTDP-4-dehydrorhamnose reductase [Sinomicrobium weinanense]MBU3123814.1 dTDP-4-dehydrorhamnose reductase [Sinomicrobium weinanense]